jgi:hypothetical protein
MGYSLPNNKYDIVRFYVTLNLNDPLYEKRLAVCKKFQVVRLVHIQISSLGS